MQPLTRVRWKLAVVDDGPSMFKVCTLCMFGEDRGKQAPFCGSCDENFKRGHNTKDCVKENETLRDYYLCCFASACCITVLCYQPTNYRSSVSQYTIVKVTPVYSLAPDNATVPQNFHDTNNNVVHLLPLQFNL